jgi:hypothetical protein
MRVLWNQFIGFLFLVLSVTIIAGAIRRSSDPERGMPMLVTALLFGVFLAYFGVTSFLRARKISRAR